MSAMRFAQFQTRTKILAAFAIVSLATLIISFVALWRMAAADATTRELVNDKLARVQLTSELLGVVRLNGARATTIARSDSLELSDYFGAQLAQGEKTAVAIAGRLQALPSEPAERVLLDAAAARQAAYVTLRQKVFDLKDLGKTQEAEQLAGGELAAGFDAWTGALDALLTAQSTQAHGMAAASAASFRWSRALLGGIGVAALLLGCTTGWLLARSIVVPLRDAVALAERVAQGDLNSTIDHARGDEIGRLFDALNHMTGGVSGTVRKVLDSAGRIDEASCELAAGNRDLARRTEQQARSLHRTVQVMAELTDAVQQNHVNAHDANQEALAASQVAREGADAVARMVERMDTIRASAARIGDITAMIDGIAFQTNILALNAAVEAARAGTEGRGFAVVASEVRNLAQHSAAAAKEIKELIGESLGAIEAGTDIATGAGATMRQIVERVQGVAGLLDAIDAASAEQAQGIAGVRGVIADMDEATQQNAAMVEQATAASETMRVQAAHLTDVVGTFRVRAPEAGAAEPVAGPRASSPMLLQEPAYA
jgi:methyl-accepting chemotaxis protein